MNSQLIAQKVAEVENLVKLVPEERKEGARIAALTVLLLKGPSDNTASQILNELSSPVSNSILTSIRQLARITKRKGITGDRVALALACYIKAKEKRQLTSADCRKYWDVLCQKSFATTWIHNAEGKGWLQPIEENGESMWAVTHAGHNEFVSMQKTMAEGEEATSKNE